MTDRKRISVSEDVFAEAKAHKGDRTWDELVLDGAHASDTGGQDDGGHDDTQPAPLTADDVPLLRREIADEIEDRMTRR